MSEDVDIKIIPSIDIQKKSRSVQRKLRGEFYQKLRDLLEEHEIFELTESKKLDEGKFLYHIQYPRYHQLIEAIRPVIQLEITESPLLEPPIIKPVSSMYAEALRLSPELLQCPCATIEVTASEKFVSLLRRTSAYARDNEKKDDEVLIRHIYDLHLINQSNADMTKISRFIEQVIKIDMEEFGNQHLQFRDEPYKELRYGFKLLQEDIKHKNRYQNFIGPLVYNQNPASWEEALESLNEKVVSWIKI
ncbi:hypothetical protein Lpar_3143 [Legionella parisiensis]|uniref:Uncharacterized protein n=2 Tax=Legionella parisiensis TaxID=45071 RepID=A0A1E5JU60_9GAMM|nr:hypothetical protein Lpar_3143 [Legionella parisiensis]OEH48062.1 hypothetical protein lpari_00933 [Legionella parisiensis]STX75847.1 Nucleotidyl transferase of uncharacterised function (DUF1814) [Legionella parisiensis]